MLAAWLLGGASPLSAVRSSSKSLAAIGVGLPFEVDESPVTCPAVIGGDTEYEGVITSPRIAVNRLDSTLSVGTTLSVSKKKIRAVRLAFIIDILRMDNREKDRSQCLDVMHSSSRSSRIIVLYTAIQTAISLNLDPLLPFTDYFGAFRRLTHLRRTSRVGFRLCLPKCSARRYVVAKQKVC